jgi:hypothetical protein
MLSCVLALIRQSLARVAPPPLTPPHKGEGDVSAAHDRNRQCCTATTDSERSPIEMRRSRATQVPPSPLWGGIQGGGATRVKLGYLAVLLLTTIAAAPAAENHDPDWPCIQRKVPELSLGQIWTGPELPASARDWAKDKDIAVLVEELAARRVPVEDAQKQIRDFASGMPAGQAKDRMTMLVQGLFDHMNAERSEVISGIGRYARKQVELAGRLRKEASELDALRAEAGADTGDVAARTDRLTWETRIFEERVQSLSYVCEVPTLIEQRLYALASTIAEVMAGQ